MILDSTESGLEQRRVTDTVPVFTSFGSFGRRRRPWMFVGRFFCTITISFPRTSGIVFFCVTFRHDDTAGFNQGDGDVALLHTTVC